MILVDANLLVYAYIKDLPQHEAALEWLDRQLNEVPEVGLPWSSLLAFVRLVSIPASSRTRFPCPSPGNRLKPGSRRLLPGYLNQRAAMQTSLELFCPQRA